MIIVCGDLCMNKIRIKSLYVIKSKVDCISKYILTNYKFHKIAICKKLTTPHED